MAQAGVKTPMLIIVGEVTRLSETLNWFKRQQDAACRISALEDRHASFRFDEAQWAITPGQSVVVYDGEVCLGGGIIA